MPKNDDKNRPRDQARRRLLKLGIYVAPTILSLSAFVGQSGAQPAPRVGPRPNPKVRVTIV